MRGIPWPHATRTYPPNERVKHTLRTTSLRLVESGVADAPSTWGRSLWPPSTVRRRAVAPVGVDEVDTDTLGDGSRCPLRPGRRLDDGDDGDDGEDGNEGGVDA